MRYATQNPYSYVHSNIGGHVTLLEALKATEPMPALVYASSSSVYGLNTKQPFSESDRVDQPASLYASTKRVRSRVTQLWYDRASGFMLSLPSSEARWLINPSF